jgi:hypothetical protein
MAVAKPKPVVIAVDLRRHTPKPIKPQMRRIVLIAVAVAMSAIGLVAVASFASGYTQEQRAGCVIKGNISISGERIYHTPEQRYYDKTLVNRSKGERWFCTEDEAIAAGWRKAKV